MLKNTLSLNRLANVFHVILKKTKEYEEKQINLTKEQKIEALGQILRVVNICIDVIDRRTRLKGISRDFVNDARVIKSKQFAEDKNWYEHLNVLEWFK